MARQGWQGWDDYAAFYDWENARTFGRRDLAFWRELAAAQSGPVLELGCGTGRLLMPIARSGADLTGLDRSAPMLDLARARARRLPRAVRPALVRGDIRDAAVRVRIFGLVMAPYGMLQSLLNDRDLDAALRRGRARAARRRRCSASISCPTCPHGPSTAERVPAPRRRPRRRPR